MKLYSSFRYQVCSHKNDLSLYYLIILCLHLLEIVVAVPITLAGTENGTTVIATTNGLSAVSCMFMMIAGICSFRENFSMTLQNGVSRRSLFLGGLCASAVLSLIMSVMDEILCLLFQLLDLLPGVQLESHSLLETTYSSALSGLLPALTALAAIPFSFCLLLAFWGLGYFISVLFYRLGKLGRLLIGIGSGLLFLAGLPGIFELYSRYPQWPIWAVLENMLWKLFLLAFGAPWNTGVSCLVLFAVFSFFTWLLMRRVALKK